MTGGEQKSIAIFPLRVMRVVTQKARPKHVSHRRSAERQAGMARLGFLDRVECQGTNGVDAQLIEFWVGVFFLHRRTHQLSSLSRFYAKTQRKQRRKEERKFTLRPLRLLCAFA